MRQPTSASQEIQEWHDHISNLLAEANGRLLTCKDGTELTTINIRINHYKSVLKDLAPELAKIEQVQS